MPPATDVMPSLALSPETAFFILLKVREFDGKVEPTDPDSASNAADDKEVDVLEDTPDDAAYEELVSAIGALDDDERRDLIALIWIGRGDFGLGEWEEARAAAGDIGRERAPRYVAGIPMASDYLEEALSSLGFSLQDYVDRH